MKKLTKFYWLFVVVLLLLGVIASTSRIVRSQQVKIESYDKHSVERVMQLEDKSFVIEIDGKLYRAFNSEAMQSILRNEKTMRYLSNALRECDGELNRRNRAE